MNMLQMYVNKKKKQSKIAKTVTHQIPLLMEIRVCWVFINVPLLPLFHHLLLSPQDLYCTHARTHAGIENCEFIAVLM